MFFYMNGQEARVQIDWYAIGFYDIARRPGFELLKVRGSRPDQVPEHLASFFVSIVQPEYPDPELVELSAFDNSHPFRFLID